MPGILTNIQTSHLLNTSQKVLQLESDRHKINIFKVRKTQLWLSFGQCVERKLHRVFNSVHQVHFHDAAVPLFTAMALLFSDSLLRRGGPQFAVKTRRFPGSLPRRGDSPVHCHEAVPRFTATTRLFQGHWHDEAATRFTTTRRFPRSLPVRGCSPVHCHDAAVPRFSATTWWFPGSLPRRGASPFHCHDTSVTQITATRWVFPRSLPRREGSPVSQVSRYGKL